MVALGVPRIFWGQGQGVTHEDVEAVAVEQAVAVHAVVAAVAARAGEEAEQEQVPEHGPHGATAGLRGQSPQQPQKWEIQNNPTRNP